LNQKKAYDAIIIGSGFGGTMTAQKLVNAGMNVLMIERGDWVIRSPKNWDMRGSIDLTEHYDKSSPLSVIKGGNKKVMGLYSCVGGPSVFYGGVSFRFREQDFEKNEEIVGKDGEGWPYKYADIEKYYTEAEGLLKISGEANVDPTEPPRSAPFPQSPGKLSGISEKVKSGAQSLGLHPFQLPLAINYEDDSNRETCKYCTTCDTFACAISAKNDLATVVLPKLLDKGMDLKPSTVVTRLVAENGAIHSVECTSKKTGEKEVYKAKYVILSAGAMGSPHILLSSGLETLNPGGKNVGRYLMRHVNSIIFGIFPGVADKESRFHKQLAILDYYLGHPDIKSPMGKLGSLQQMPTPPMGLVQNEIPGPLGKMLSQGVRLLSGLLAIAEDQPQFSNFIKVNPSQKDKFGMPQPVVSHEYSKRDLAALKALINPAKKIMSRAGAIAHYVHNIRTFSHAVGTVRMGTNSDTSALDEFCQFRGVDNLFVVDGSFMPTSAAVNPSLTISANALRVGEHILDL
jgi:choline dehydrogenase-like flavoprotein